MDEKTRIATIVLGSERGQSAFATEDAAREYAELQEARGMLVEWGRRGDEPVIPGSDWIDELIGNPGWIVRWRSR